MNRETFRARTVGAQKVFKSTLVDLGEGVMAYVRQPSIKARAAIVSAAKARAKGDQVDIAELQTEAVIRCTFIDDALVFDPTDRESLMEQPSGGWFDKLAEAAFAYLNVDQKDLEKNSAGAASADSSSSSPNASAAPSTS